MLFTIAFYNIYNNINYFEDPTTLLWKQGDYFVKPLFGIWNFAMIGNNAEDGTQRADIWRSFTDSFRELTDTHFVRCRQVLEYNNIIGITVKYRLWSNGISNIERISQQLEGSNKSQVFRLIMYLSAVGLSFQITLVC